VLEGWIRNEAGKVVQVVSIIFSFRFVVLNGNCPFQSLLRRGLPKTDRCFKNSFSSMKRRKSETGKSVPNIRRFRRVERDSKATAWRAAL
jgi:hypothetical protein